MRDHALALLMLSKSEARATWSGSKKSRQNIDAVQFTSIKQVLFARPVREKTLVMLLR